MAILGLYSSAEEQGGKCVNIYQYNNDLHFESDIYLIDICISNALWIFFSRSRNNSERFVRNISLMSFFYSILHKHIDKLTYH